MEQKRLEWRVGLFVLVGLVLAAVLLLQFSKGTSLFRSTYKLYLTTRNVGGLKRHASVLMAGVPVGSVSQITLDPGDRSVTITLQIYDKYTIHQDALFQIETSGFLGDQFVAITPTANKEPPFKPGGHALAQEPFNLQEVARSASGFIQRIDNTAQKLNDAISDVRRLLLNEQTLTNLASTIGTMRVASERALATVNNVNALVDTNGPAIALAVSNVVFFSDQINEFADAFGGVLTTNSTELTEAMKNIESSTAILKSLLEDAKAGRGLAGTVLQNQTLATNVEAIAQNLAITTSNLNREGLWGILWARRPPRTNAPPQKLESPRNPFD